MVATYHSLTTCGIELAGIERRRRVTGESTDTPDFTGLVIRRSGIIVLMRPADGEVLHFSEDPTIELFMPHVAKTAKQPERFVWAVDAVQAPAYWFPRQCPRAMAWVGSATTPVDRDRVIGAGAGSRVHAIEYAWLDALATVELFAYRLPADPFVPSGDESEPHAMVASEPVEPLGPAEPVGDLLALHAAAGIQLRVLVNLWSFWDEVVSSSLPFSGIRLGNAAPRPAARV